MLQNPWGPSPRSPQCRRLIGRSGPLDPARAPRRGPLALPGARMGVACAFWVAGPPRPSQGSRWPLRRSRAVFGACHYRCIQARRSRYRRGPPAPSSPGASGGAGGLGPDRRSGRAPGRSARAGGGACRAPVRLPLGCGDPPPRDPGAARSGNPEVGGRGRCDAGLWR